jgi:ATP-dependent Clp protease ATP-binding subunit ClpX
MLASARTAEASGPSIIELYDACSEIKGQDVPKKRLATVFWRQARIRAGHSSSSHGVLIVGPSGAGKTRLSQLMGEASGIPFAQATATKFSETGYAGLDLEQMFRPLLKAAIEEQLRQARWARIMEGEEVKLERAETWTKLPDEVLRLAIEDAETGVILLDEFDKWMLRSDDGLGRDPGRALMAELLTMIEGTLVWIRDDDGEVGLPFRTDRVRVICAGAFTGLPAIVNRRLNREDSPKIDAGSIWNQVTHQDLFAFGLLPELVGRLPLQIAFSPLRTQDLTEILSTPGGLLDEYRELFAELGTELIVPEGSVGPIAELAMKREVGARGLRWEMETILAEALFEAGRHRGSGTVLLDPTAAHDRKAVYRAA